MNLHAVRFEFNPANPIRFIQISDSIWSIDFFVALTPPVIPQVQA